MNTTKVTKKQADWLSQAVVAPGVEAFSAGMGSNGYPPGPDAWALLKDGRSVWVSPEAEERVA